MTNSAVSWMIFLPLFGAVLQLVLKGSKGYWLGFCLSVFSSLITMILLGAKWASPEHAWVDHVEWIKFFSIHYQVDLDGFAVLPLLLVQIVSPVVLFLERRMDYGLRGFTALVLMTQSSMAGMVCSQDLFLLFTFWSFSVFPIFFLTTIWGDDGRTRSGLHYFGLSLVGSALALIGVILIFQASPGSTFLISDLSKGLKRDTVESIAFLLIILGFCARLPIFPVQGWFHRVVSTSIPSVSILTTALVVPASLAALGRVLLPIFHAEVEEFSIFILGYGVLQLIVFSISACTSKRVAEMMADFSGLLLGAFAAGLATLKFSGVVGGYFGLLAFGLSLTVLGVLSKYLVQNSGEDAISSSDEEGSSKSSLILGAPAFGLFGALGFLSASSVPGFAGFISFSMILMGLHSIDLAWPLCVSLALLISSYAGFRAFRSIYLSGQRTPSDFALSRGEALVFIPLFLGLVIAGVYPKFLLDLVHVQFEQFLGGVS